MFTTLFQAQNLVLPTQDLVSKDGSKQRSAGYVCVIRGGGTRRGKLDGSVGYGCGREKHGGMLNTPNFYTIKKMFSVLFYLQCGSRQTMLEFLMKICSFPYQC